MGAYVSVSQCPNTSANMCTSNFNTSNGDLSVGTYLRGQVPANPDIAGIGIISVFIAVTSFAMAMSIIDLFWRSCKLWKRMAPMENRLSLTEICEALVMTCSDQQAFTGGAYAISLRYWNGCSITAYHYNIVANMMLLTCATHLMSITTVCNYYKSRWQSILRVFIIVCVVLVTGVILSNQDAKSDIPFPTTPPPPQNETDMGLMFLPAACFQGKNTHLVRTLQDSFNGTDDLQRSLLFSTAGRGNHIQGWNEYIIMLAWYLLSILVMVVRRFYHKQRDGGFMFAIGRTFVPCCFADRKPDKEGEQESKAPTHNIFKWIHTIYMFLGVIIGSAIVFTSSVFIMKLRGWAKHSGWLESELGGTDPEDDPTSFGQLVPIFLSLLTIFTLAQTVNEMWDKRHCRRHTSTISLVNNISSSPDSQNKPLGKYSPAEQEIVGPEAPSTSSLIHSYSWTSQGLNTPPTHSAMRHPGARLPTRSFSGFYEEPRVFSGHQPPSSYDGGSPTPDTNSSNHAGASMNTSPPVSLDSGSPPPLRHVSSSFSITSCPSTQPLLQSPGSWAQFSPEASYFPIQTPPRSSPNFSIPRKAV